MFDAFYWFSKTCPLLFQRLVLEDKVIDFLCAMHLFLYFAFDRLTIKHFGIKVVTQRNSSSLETQFLNPTQKWFYSSCQDSGAITGHCKAVRKRRNRDLSQVTPVPSCRHVTSHRQRARSNKCATGIRLCCKYFYVGLSSFLTGVCIRFLFVDFPGENAGLQS